MKNIILILIVLFLFGCAAGGVAPLIKSAADTSATVSKVTENLLETDVISVEDATQVYQTIDSEVIPRIEAASTAYAQYLFQLEVYNVDNNGDDLATKYILFANDYLRGLCLELKIDVCQ